MKDDVIRRVVVGGGITTVYRSRAFEKEARAFAKRNVLRAYEKAGSALNNRRLNAARGWLRYAASELSLLAPGSMRTLCATWLGLVWRLAELSQEQP